MLPGGGIDMAAKLHLLFSDGYICCEEEDRQ